MTYRPNYTKKDIDSSKTRDKLILEESVQRAAAENETWLLAKKMGRSSADNRTAKEALEALGFTVLDKAINDIFFLVQQPKGWTKETQGYWMTVRDQDGKERISQFFKGASHDHDAFLKFKE